jgi:uncharacterized Zn finger protein (UPF0148 family)
VKCPKCGASLFSDTWYPADTSCPICGLYIPATKDVALPMDKKKMIGTFKQTDSASKRVLLRPCPVKGCSGTIRIDSTQPMCAKCKQKIADWKKTRQLTMPPIIEMNGELIMRKMVNVEVAE